MTSPSGLKLRLWVVALALFAIGAIARSVFLYQGNEAYSYPYAVEFQLYPYGAALAVLALWILFQTRRARQLAIGCVLWLFMAIASVAAVLSSIPK
jgi:hypothetical protein